MTQRIEVIDSHTEGEPTRVIVNGGPDLGTGSAADRCQRFGTELDAFRSAVVNEPRGGDAWVGAVLASPSSPSSEAQVIFFNNVGTLGMCVHGTIGVVATLAHLGRIGPGSHRLETPVGEVTAHLDADGTVAVDNVLSYRHRTGVEVLTTRFGPVPGEIAYGGNWFFLVQDPDPRLSIDRLEELTDFTWDIRQSLAREGITGAGGAEIDHIELFGPPTRADADSKNFVLCPGKAYDRSPCGTGTSAKMACLAADGKLADGELWRQESIIGSRFTGSVRTVAGGVIPTVRGRAYVTAESTLVLDPEDPLRDGIGR